MIEKEIDIATADGDMNTFITHPEEEGPHPVVLFLMDAPGKRGDRTAPYGEHAFLVGIGRDSGLIGDHRAD